MAGGAVHGGAVAGAGAPSPHLQVPQSRTHRSTGPPRTYSEEPPVDVSEALTSLPISGVLWEEDRSGAREVQEDRWEEMEVLQGSTP